MNTFKLNPKAKDVHKLAMDAGQKHFQVNSVSVLSLRFEF